jgi:hypothetical protein
MSDKKKELRDIDFAELELLLAAQGKILQRPNKPSYDESSLIKFNMRGKEK